MAINALKGTKDIFGTEIRNLQKVESIIREVCENFGIGEIRTPIFELTHLFQRGVGTATDIVQKEMYSFVDKGDNNITLKPESTAAVVRAYLERNLGENAQPTKLYYISPTFRYERPEAGRLRQFHQFGVEVFGSSAAIADAEVIAVANTLLKRLNIANVKLYINSLGGPKCREKYNQQLKNFLETKKDNLCSLCNERRIKNPLRVLDCKNEDCQKLFADAPTTLDALDPECREHFDTLTTLLTKMNIPFIVNPRIVRGLDYYTKTVFEFILDSEAYSGTICGGGRYDKLVEEIGGKAVPAVGFGTGIERLLIAYLAENPNQNIATRDIFIGYRGDAAMEKAMILVNDLRSQHINADTDLLNRSVKAQMKYANKIGAKYATIIGETELETATLLVKNMKTYQEHQIKFEDLLKFLFG
ncbi:histidine--tRNA ligase [Candidatus Epulonipiscium viviparus]|uniref:histidine--tRNA ligase n=1 Tax=Candidatus Epulonipiscium viviparus TaxID=420336 RepID=UPI00049802F8|nr:histidine--tRNA ligase [Candidatus Epulopiscium viviparus]